MRAFIALIFLCLMCGNVVANSVQDSATPADAIIKAEYDYLRAAYLCRDVVGADRYLRARSIVKAIELGFMEKEDIAETLVKKMENEIQISLKYHSKNISAEECDTLLKAGTHQLYLAMDSLFKL